MPNRSKGARSHCDSRAILIRSISLIVSHHRQNEAADYWSSMLAIFSQFLIRNFAYLVIPLIHTRAMWPTSIVVASTSKIWHSDCYSIDGDESLINFIDHCALPCPIVDLLTQYWLFLPTADIYARTIKFVKRFSAYRLSR